LATLRGSAQLDEQEGASCNAERPRLEPVASQRINSIFRTDGTVWSGAVPRFGNPRTSAPRWGEEQLPMNGLPEPLDPFTEAITGALVWVLKSVLDRLYRDQADFARFFVLETVARVPYFAYISVLHLYESLGRHKRAAWMKVHFAEADNELHHLLIMEALGGSERFQDRVFAQHSAVAALEPSLKKSPLYGHAPIYQGSTPLSLA